MKRSKGLTRRHFVRNGLMVSAFLTACGQPAGAAGAFGNRSPDRGLNLGITTYTFRKFSLDQALAMTQEAGLKYISLKEMHLPLKSSLEERIAARDKVKAAGLVLTGGGVIYLKNE